MTAVPMSSNLYEVDSYRSLMEQVIAGNGLSGLARTLSEILGLTTTIGDEDLQPLHAYGPGGRRLTAEQSAMGPGIAERVSFDLAFEPRASTAPPTLRLSDASGTDYVIAPIVVPDGVVGYVWANGPSSAITRLTEATVAQAAAAGAMEMVRQNALVEGASRVRNSFLEELLTGTVTSVNATRRRAKFLGYELRGEQIVFVLDMDRFMDYVKRKDYDESAIQRVKDRFRRSVEAAIPATWSRNLLWDHSDSVVALVPVGKESNPGALIERVELLRANVEARLAGPSVSAGIGRGCHDLAKLKDSYQQAEHALMIGAAVSGASATTFFDSLGAYRLLFYLRDQPELEKFYDETLGRLARYDEQHHGHMVDTLAVFLDLEGNLSETARRLHLHRNGLLYRISRLQTIGDCNLNDPSQRLALQLALLARPLLQKRKK
jgi:PucR family transcriptional regulator, purine catabolism regulatory protein